MFKRVTWFTVGATVGAGATVVGYLKAREAARRHVPPTVSDAAARVADVAATQARSRAEQARLVAGDALILLDEWRELTDDGREVRRQAEQRLRTELDRAGL